MKKKYVKPESEVIIIQNTAILCSSDNYDHYDDDDDDDRYDNSDDDDDDVGAMHELFDGMIGIEH